MGQIRTKFIPTETLYHEDLIDMPDTGGTNSDHDARYYTETEITTNFVPYTGANTDVNLGTHNLILSDNAKTYFGTESDASIHYNAINLVFDSQEVGTGDFYFRNGKVGIGIASPEEKLHVLGNVHTDGNINITETNAYLYDGITALKLSKGADDFYANTFVGDGAGNPASFRQTAVGYKAGDQNTNSYNVSMGYLAGYQNIGEYQVCIGVEAGYQNTGDEQTAVGFGTGNQNIGFSQTSFGFGAGYLNEGASNIGIGRFAGRENTGDQVLGVGYEATRENTASDIIAIGYQAGKANATANQFIVKQTNINATPLMQGDLSSNYLGLNTVTPQTNLDISAVKDTTLRLTSTKNDNSWVSGTDSIGGVEFYTNDASGGGTNVVGYMKLVVNGTAGNVWDLHFGASSNNAPSSTNLKLLSTGQTTFGSNDYIKIKDDIAITHDRKITIDNPYILIDLTLAGDEIVLKNNRVVAAGWARSLLRFTDDDGVNYFTMGALGNAQSITYNYLAGVDAHADPIVRWTTDGKLLLGQTGGETIPTNDFETLKDFYYYADDIGSIYGAAGDSSVKYNGTDFVYNSQEVGTGNHKFTGGDIILDGGSRVGRHIRIGASSLKQGASSPTEGFTGIFPHLSFSHTVNQEAHYHLIIPNRRDSSTDMEICFDWLYTGAQDNGTVKWVLEYNSKKAGEDPTAGSVTISDTTAGNHTTGQMISTCITTKILAANIENDDDMGIRIYRDQANDTLGTGAILLGVHFYFVQDKLGEVI